MMTKLSKPRRQDVLQKLRPLHPLPGVILEWRRITNALTKVVFPLQREKKYQPMINMDRIYSIAQTHTATGITLEHRHKQHTVPAQRNVVSIMHSLVSPHHISPSLPHVGRQSELHRAQHTERPQRL